MGLEGVRHSECRGRQRGGAAPSSPGHLLVFEVLHLLLVGWHAGLVLGVLPGELQLSRLQGGGQVESSFPGRRHQPHPQSGARAGQRRPEYLAPQGPNPPRAAPQINTTTATWLQGGSGSERPHLTPAPAPRFLVPKAPPAQERDGRRGWASGLLAAMPPPTAEPWGDDCSPCFVHSAWQLSGAGAGAVQCPAQPGSDLGWGLTHNTSPAQPGVQVPALSQLRGGCMRQVC